MREVPACYLKNNRQLTKAKAKKKKGMLVK
jgi:hypothetical protein